MFFFGACVIFRVYDAKIIAVGSRDNPHKSLPFVEERIATWRFGVASHFPETFVFPVIYFCFFLDDV